MLKNASLSVLLIIAAVAAGCSSDEPTTEASYPESSGAESTEPMTAEAEPMAEAPATTDPAQTSEPVGAGLDPVSPGREPAQAAKASDLTDEQIAKITETVDNGEIEQAKVAQTKAKDASVKQFAKQMATHHQKAKREGAQVAKQADMTPAESPVAEDLKRKGEETLQTLKTTDRAGFDQTYMDSQVSQHQEVLNLIDQQLMPSAESPELKAQLEKARTMVDSHLTEAKQIQAKLSDTAAADTQASAQ